MRAPQAMPSSTRFEQLRAALVPLVLLGVAGVLWCHPFAFANPVAPGARLPPGAADVGTTFHPNLKPQARFGQRMYACSACHNKFRSIPDSRPALYMHGRIILRHGMNTRCLNCHNEQNRDALIDDWGREIPYDQPQLLCGKCHGEVYRDWLNGAHGRANGYWDPNAGPRERRLCDECHDPHQPRFPPTHPAPPPHTLRMGDQEFATPDSETKDPLRIFRQELPQSPEPPPTTQPDEIPTYEPEEDLQ